jgi:hypothetical protein
MSFTDKIIFELEIDPDITYADALLRIPNLKYKTFHNVRSKWRKRNGNGDGKVGKKRGKSKKSAPGTHGLVPPKQNNIAGSLALPTDPDLEGLTDLEILKFQYRKKAMELNPDLRALDSFRQYLKEAGEFEAARPELEEEIENKILDKEVEELVQLALGEQRLEFLLTDEPEDSLSPSETSLDS